MDVWINKMWHIHTMYGVHIHYLALKRKEILTHYNINESWRHMLSEIIPPQKDKHYIWFSLYEVSAAVLCLVDLSCPTLCNPKDCILHGIPQTRILEWVAITFSRGSSQSRESNPGLLHCTRILYQLSHVKNPPANAGDSGLIPGWEEDPLEKNMATHSSILAWKIPWTQELGRPQCMASQSRTWLSDWAHTHKYT